MEGCLCAIYFNGTEPAKFCLCHELHLGAVCSRWEECPRWSTSNSLRCRPCKSETISCPDELQCWLWLQKISAETAFARPHTPTVHVLILPSQLPLDLRLGIRDLNEAWLVRWYMDTSDPGSLWPVYRTTEKSLIIWTCYLIPKRIVMCVLLILRLASPFLKSDLVSWENTPGNDLFWRTSICCRSE